MRGDVQLSWPFMIQERIQGKDPPPDLEIKKGLEVPFGGFQIWDGSQLPAATTWLGGEPFWRDNSQEARDLASAAIFGWKERPAQNNWPLQQRPKWRFNLLVSG